MQLIFNFFSKHKLLLLGIAIVWTILIIIGVSLPGKNMPKVNLFSHVDKIVHFVLFFGFCILWYWYFVNSKNSLWLSITIGILFGIVIEFYQQACIPGRSFDVWDIAADAAGCFTVLLYRVKEIKK